MLTSLVKYISNGAIAQVHDVVEVLLTSVFRQNLLLGIKAKELLLNLRQLCDMVLQLVLV